jgi:putative ABC transport system ATP-binding protein
MAQVSTASGPQTGTDNIAVLEDINKTYKMGEVEIHALRNVNLELKRGEFLAVLGPSGSGKTTLLNLLGGIDTPTTGRIAIDGQDISHFNRRRLTWLRREKIGFVFQFFNLIPTLTAKENVEYAIELASRDKVPPSRNALQLLDMVGLKERVNHFPSQLSGGEQQRVAVARALAKDPVLVLGDEPTGNLDYRMGKLVLKTLKDLNDKEGKTIIVVTHNMPIAQIADRIIYLHDGGIAKVEVNEKPVSPDEVVW